MSTRNFPSSRLIKEHPLTKLANPVEENTARSKFNPSENEEKVDEHAVKIRTVKSTAIELLHGAQIPHKRANPQLTNKMRKHIKAAFCQPATKSYQLLCGQDGPGRTKNRNRLCKTFFV